MNLHQKEKKKVYQIWNSIWFLIFMLDIMKN